MKPPSDTFICPKRSISFCPRKLESKFRIKTLFPQNFKIYNACPCVIPPKEIKLLQKLLKSKAAYDDTRNQVICKSLTSLDGKSKKNLSPCEAQKLKAIVHFINTVDKGGAPPTAKERKQPTIVCVNDKSSCTRPSSRERSVQAQEQDLKPSPDAAPEKPRKQTNVFIKRVVKKCCNRTTCVQVQAIESIDKDSACPKGKNPSDNKDLMKCFPIEKDLLNDLPKECRKVVKSVTKLECPKAGNDMKMQYIARCCIKKRPCDEKQLVQNKSSKNIGCQKETMCRKASQAKICLFKKGTRTEPCPKGGCCAKVKARLKPKPCSSNRSILSLNSIIRSRDKLCMKSCPQKIQIRRCDVCKCNKKTQTKKICKKDVKQNAKKGKVKKSASCIKLNVDDKKKENTTAIVCVKMFKEDTRPPICRTKSETFRFATCFDKCARQPTAIFNSRKINTGKPKCRSQSCNTIDESQNKCVETKNKKPKRIKCPGKDKHGTCPAKDKNEKCPAKQKQEKCPAKNQEVCPAKSPKCQVVRIGSNFSFHIEFYKNRTKERRPVPAKCGKKCVKNKGSSTKCATCKPNKVKTVATTTKPTCCSVCYSIKKLPQKSKPKPVSPPFKPTCCSVCYCLKPNPRKNKSKTVGLTAKPPSRSVSYCVKATPRKWKSKPSCPNYEESSTLCLNLSDDSLKSFSEQSIVNNCCYAKNIKYQCRVLQAYTLKNMFKRNKHNQIAKEFVRKYIDKDFEPVLIEKNECYESSCTPCVLKPRTFFRSFFKIVTPLNLSMVNRLYQFCLQVYFTIPIYSLESKFCYIEQIFDSHPQATIKITKNVLFKTVINILGIFILTCIH